MIKIADLLTKAEIKKVNSFMVNNQPQKLRDYLNEDKRKAKLLKKGVVSDYLYYWLLYQAMQKLGEANKRYEEKEKRKQKEHEGRLKQDFRKDKPQEKSS